MLCELKDFIQSNPDAHGLKRAVAVQRILKGYKHWEIQESLSVSSGFISKWTALYAELSVSGLKLRHKGEGERYTPEVKYTESAWEMNSSMTYVLANMGIPNAVFDSPLPPGGLAEVIAMTGIKLN